MPPKSKTFQERFAYIMHVVPGGALLFALIPLVVCGYLGWYYYGSKTLDQSLYSLRMEQVQVTDQPGWILTPVLAEVFKSNRLDRINLLEPSASASIAGAFETHPWVEKTTRVQKVQGRSVTVDVIYRRPVAMVQVHYYPVDETGTPTADRREGYYPVDHKGVVLPVGDFKQNLAKDWDYPIIEIENMEHSGAQAGLTFNDSRVMEALRFINFLDKQWTPKQLGIKWIRVRRDDGISGATPWILELWTSDQRTILWGRSPGEEAVGENTAERKLAEMASWLEAQRRSPAGTMSLNLMDNRATPVSKRL